MEAAAVRLVCVLCCGMGWTTVAAAVFLVVVITTGVIVGVHTGGLTTTVCSVFHLFIGVG